MKISSLELGSLKEDFTVYSVLQSVTQVFVCV